MATIDQEPQPNNQKFIRLLTVGTVLVGSGAVIGGKVVLEANSKASPAAAITEQIPGGLTPIATALREQGIIMPALTPALTATPTPESTPTTVPATKTPEPTKTPLPPKERPTALTAENFNEFVGTVSKEEFQKLAKAQPDAFAFPVKPVSGNLEITYQDKPNTSSAATKGNYKAISITGSDLLLISAIDGDMIIRKDDHSNKDKITSIWIHRKLSENKFLTLYIYTGNSNNISLIENAGPTERGQALAKVSGKVGISLYLQELLPEPIVINRPDGGKTEFNGYLTYLTPDVFESSNWVNQNGKTATSQN